MPRLPPLPDLETCLDGTLRARPFDDGYFSADDGLAETRGVFLRGCGLPGAWAGRGQFLVGELGFGTGLNALALWDLWRAHRPPGAVLHMLTIEAMPMPRETAARALAAWPELADLAARLLARWPVRASGLQRLWFPEDGFCLTVAIGEAGAILPQLSLRADAWFLDGFAPARNPQMWTPEVLAQVARLSAPGARAATYSVAGAVRRGLAEAGFEVSRHPGHGRKRERLEARWSGTPAPERAPARDVLVLGGGIAGAAAAAAFVRRGHAVTLLDPDPCGGIKASGNPAALIMPRLDRGETREARFLRAAYVQAVRTLEAMGPDAFTACGVEERARPGSDPERIANLVADPPLPEDWLSPLPQGRLLHRTGGTARPQDVRRALLAGVRVLDRAADRLARDAQGRWQALDGGGQPVASGDVCVVAAGPSVARLSGLDLPLEGRLGQVTLAPGAAPDVPVSGSAYAMGFEAWVLAGATFDPWPLEQPPAPVQAQDHLRNRNHLAEVAPEVAATLDMAAAWGRTAVRTCTRDRMPLAGPTGPDGLFVLGGLGSRGFTTAFLCAEIVASQALDEPLPVERDLADAVAPLRFARRAAARGR